MPVLNVMRYLLVGMFCSCLTLSGCGYRFSASVENRLAAGQTAWVEFPRNLAMSQSAQTLLKRALYEELHALRGITPASDSSSAAVRIDGAIRSANSYALSYTSLDRIREFRLTLDVELEVFASGAATPLWKGTIQSSRDYPSNTNLSLQREAEDAALGAASHDIARKLVMALEQNY